MRRSFSSEQGKLKPSKGYTKLFWLIALLIYGQFFLGGAITCLAIGAWHSQLAGRPGK